MKAGLGTVLVRYTVAVPQPGGIRWAKEYATAGELQQLAYLGDRTLVVAGPHTLVEFVSA